MLVKEIMTKKVFSVEPDTHISRVAEILSTKNIHGVPVVEKNVPIGIITEGDLFTKGFNTVYLPEYINSLKKERFLKKTYCSNKEKLQVFLGLAAKDIMSTPCVTINQEASVMELFGLMREKNLVTVPVVDDKQILAGIVTLFDVIRLASVST